jgi:hypothetical protein
MHLQRSVRWGGGVGIFAVTWFLASCANSPSDDLARAQTELIRLEKQGAAAYMPRQIAAAKENLKIAREFIQRNRFELANGPLALARTTLDSCMADLVVMRSSAKNNSEAQYARLQSGLDSLASLLKDMPRTSYLDQNRYDLHSLKLKEMRQQASALSESIGQKDYLAALEKGKHIERHLRKSLAAVRDNSHEPVVAVTSNELK